MGTETARRFVIAFLDILCEGMIVLAPALFICMIVLFFRSKRMRGLRILSVVGAIICVLFIALAIYLAITAGSNAVPPSPIT